MGRVALYNCVVTTALAMTDNDFCLMPKCISLHLHSLLRMTTLFIFPPSIEICILHKNLPGAADFVVMEAVIIIGMYRCSNLQT